MFCACLAVRGEDFVPAKGDWLLTFCSRRALAALIASPHLCKLTYQAPAVGEDAALPFHFCAIQNRLGGFFQLKVAEAIAQPVCNHTYRKADRLFHASVALAVDPYLVGGFAVLGWIKVRRLLLKTT